MLPRHRRSSRTGTSASYGAGSRSMGAMVGKIAGVLIALAILALLARYCGIEQDVHFMVKDKVAAVDCTPQGRDQYNRTLAVCRTSSTPDLGEALVREGLAVNSGTVDKPGPYAAAQADAQAAKLGMWKGTFQQPSDSRQAIPPATN